jgi:hypothetical protein
MNKTPAEWSDTAMLAWQSRIPPSTEVSYAHMIEPSDAAWSFLVSSLPYMRLGVTSAVPAGNSTLAEAIMRSPL